jgi:hypothetical protein
MCDEHPDRPAVVRRQGETDSFGSEMNDLCQECRDAADAYAADPNNHLGTCDWCKSENVHVRPRRDWEEGSAGRVYDICDNCNDKENKRLAEEFADDDSGFCGADMDFFPDDDDGDETEEE